MPHLNRETDRQAYMCTHTLIYMHRYTEMHMQMYTYINMQMSI